MPLLKDTRAERKACPTGNSEGRTIAIEIIGWWSND